MKKYSFQIGITLLQLRDIARYGRRAASGRDKKHIIYNIENNIIFKK